MTRLPFYVLDLDGTLLRSDGSLSEASRLGLNQLLGQGARLTVASARGTPAMRSLLAGVDLRLPVMELCGAFISEFATGRHISSNLLPEAVASNVVEAVLAAGYEPLLAAWDGVEDHLYYRPGANAGVRWYVEEKQRYGDPRLRAHDDLLDVTQRARLASITIFAPDEDAPDLIELLGGLTGDSANVHGAMNAYCPGWTEVQVQHRLAEKGAAFPSLLAACGLVDVELVALGDHLVDLGLFAEADRTVAPENAQPAVLEVADEIVGTNDDDSVIEWLLDHHAAAQVCATKVNGCSPSPRQARAG
jgi:hydroxymethylpyrimidine pyrophosphatase-like HAD family hydrolase